jgi:hypothetical protein
VDAGGARPLERVLRPRPQHAVLGDQRPVEVQRERGDVRRESLGDGDRYGSWPPVDFTT